jgi:cyclophilin family peptidyl-prolyl cis-trans isomerase
MNLTADLSSLLGQRPPTIAPLARLPTANLLWSTLFAATLSCKQTTATTTDVRQSAVDSHSPLMVVTTDPVDPCTGVRPDDNATDLLEMAFEDGALPTERRRVCVASQSSAIPTRRLAHEFMLARRLPTADLAGWWDSVQPEHRGWIVRAVAGRQRALGAALPPERWNIPSRTASFATIVSRFRAEQNQDRQLSESELRTALLSSSPETQIAAARLLRMARWSPTVDELLLVSPLAVAAVVKSLADRADSAQVPWRAWAERSVVRAHAAPRLWGNAWRALRDGIPKEVRTASELPMWTAMMVAAPPVMGLPDETLAWFRCEDALAVDRWNNHVELTRSCASGAHAWVSAVAQARVLAEMHDSDAQRARALTELRQVQGPPLVTAEIATAACALRRQVALPLIGALATERDPGVLAALIEGIATHEELYRHVSPTIRDALIVAPFEGPEGPMLEARVQAVRLARATSQLALLDRYRESEVRAIQSSFAPDASVVGSATTVMSNSVQTPNRGISVVRFETDAGPFDLELDRSAAPLAVARVLQTVEQGRYTGLRFHRVVPAFVVQGGDPRGDGYGGTDTPLRTELALRAFDRGAVGVPLAGLDTGGIQLFIVTADAPHLDARYPWVGRVTRGIESVDGVLPGDRITRATITTATDP